MIYKIIFYLLHGRNETNRSSIQFWLQLEKNSSDSRKFIEQAFAQNFKFKF